MTVSYSLKKFAFNKCNGMMSNEKNETLLNFSLYSIIIYKAVAENTSARFSWQWTWDIHVMCFLQKKCRTSLFALNFQCYASVKSKNLEYLNKILSRNLMNHLLVFVLCTDIQYWHMYFINNLNWKILKRGIGNISSKH